MEMEHRVEIKKGPHSTSIPKGALKLIKRLFDCANFEKKYFFKPLLGEKVTGSSQCSEIEVKPVDGKNRSIVVISKPGDNGTRYKYYIFRPDGYTGTLDDFFRKLKEGEEMMNTHKEEKRVTIVESKEKATEPPKPEIETSTKTETEPEDRKENSPDHSEDTHSKMRFVSKILDQVMIKFILTEMGEGESIKQNEFIKKIGTLGLNCSEKRIILFLKRKGFITGHPLSRTSAVLSLTEKGKKLLGIKKEKKTVSVPPMTTAIIPEKGTVGPESNLISEFSKADADLRLAKEKVREIEEKKEEIRNKILAIIS